MKKEENGICQQCMKIAGRAMLVRDCKDAMDEVSKHARNQALEDAALAGQKAVQRYFLGEITGLELKKDVAQQILSLKEKEV